MAARPLPEDVLRDTVEVCNATFREGFQPGHGAHKEAGRRLVARGYFKNPNQIYHYLERAEMRLGITPDEGLYRPARYQQPIPKAVVSEAAPPNIPEPQGLTRVLAIGDLHQDPRHPHRLDVLTWIARYASEHRIPRVIQIGDWSTWDSVNMHDPNDTAAARLKPSIKDDMANLQASLQAWRRGVSSDYKPRQMMLAGNHENRLERFENLNPEAHQTFTVARDEAFLQFGWKIRPYGELYYCDGVAFTHHPVNGAGRAFGGKTGPQRAANETTVTVISGHTHRRQIHDAPKIGPQDVISMVEIGCGLPYGEVEAYAKHSMTGWWHGVVDLGVRSGVLTDINFVNMLSLRDRYSADGGDIRS